MKMFTVIDLKDGYYQIKLAEKDRFKTAFYFNNQLYQWTRMPQGYKNSPGIFQMIMDKILKDEINNSCNVYLDDIIIYGRTEEEHDKNLEKVLEKLNQANFKINIEKLQFKQREIRLLGAIIDGIRQRPIEEKQRKILNFEIPKTKKEVQTFIGFANYYRRYLKDFAVIAEPLTNLTKGKTEEIIWEEG